MSLTLREVLRLDILRRGGAQVVAGAGGLDRTVRWVHVTELPDIAHLLTGGELLLTTGMGITNEVEMQRKYVTELAEAGVTGVVIELGRNFSSVPSALMQTAEEVDLPLIALERETRFVEITETVHREIINHQYDLLSHAEQVSRQLTELMLEGAGAAQIVSRLAGIFQNHVVLEDEAHQIVEVAGPESDSPSVLASWQEHSRTGHEEGAKGVVHFQDADPPCMWVGLWLRQNPWGRLHVLATHVRFEESTELLVDRAGVALSLSLLSDKDAAHMADRARGALVGEVIADRHGSGLDFLRRASNLGIELGDGPLIVVALEDRKLASMIDDQALTEEDRLHTRLVLADELRASAGMHNCAALVGLSGDRVFSVMSSARSQPLAAMAEAIVAVAAERTSHGDTAVTFVAGASSEVTADTIHRGIDEATTTLSYARHGGEGHAVSHFSDLGTYHLLMSLAQGPDLARFVENELRAILDHDARVKTKLLPTLRAYLLHTGRKSDVARELCIQRRTLYARLSKIETLLNRDLEKHDSRMRLTLALQGLEILRARRSTDVATMQSKTQS